MRLAISVFGKKIFRKVPESPLSSPNLEKLIPSVFDNCVCKNFLCFKKEEYNKNKILEIRKTILLNHPIVIFTDLNEKEYETNNIRNFCKMNGLNHSCIIGVLKKRREHHKGWKARYK